MWKWLNSHAYLSMKSGILDSVTDLTTTNKSKLENKHFFCGAFQVQMCPVVIQ